MTLALEMPSNPLAWATALGFVLLLSAMTFAFIRMVRGPSLPDRVVALDLLAILMASFAALLAIAADDPAFLDVALVLALVAFLTTVALARYAERRRRPGGSPTTPPAGPPAASRAFGGS